MANNYFSKLLAFTFLLSISISSISQTVYPNYQDGKIWFKLKDNVTIPNYFERQGSTDKVDMDNLNFSHLDFVESIAKSYDLTLLKKPFHQAKKGKGAEKLQRTYELHFNNPQQIDAIIEQLAKNVKVEYAEMVPLDKPTFTPNDPNYNSSTQWGLFKINAANAWNTTQGDPNIVVAIVDDAVEINHSDLSANIYTNPGEVPNNNIDDDGNGYIDDVNGYDVGSNDNNPSPPNSSYSHGTHVAGISGAATNNNTGVASIGFGISILPVKATNTPTFITQGYNGIIYAANTNADVINMSWGGSGSSTSAQNVINWASNQGIILIAAAGNDNVQTQFYPAAYNNVISVASTSTNDSKSGFSNYGNWIDVSAPGSSIYSTVPFGGYGYKSGTSMASPMVAGLAGLVWSVNPNMSKADVENCILNNADNIDSQNPSYIGKLGSGRINAEQAVLCAAQTTNSPPTALFTAAQEVSGTVTVLEGTTVNFQDLSSYSPNSWSWSFPGGTPSTSTQKNPNITYNTAGTYNVTLIASNNNGSDTETKTGYVVVQANTGCDTLHVDNMFATTSGWPTLYCAGPCTNGYMAGTNTFGDNGKAEYFNDNTYDYCYGTHFWIFNAYDNNPNTTVEFFIKDGTGGTPGATIESVNVPMSVLMSNVQNNFATRVIWDNPAAIPTSGEFFIGVRFPNLNWNTDTLLIVQVADNNVNNSGWEQYSDNTWHPYTDNYAFNTGTAHYIDALMSDQPAVATFTPSNNQIICEGDAISFDATGSTYGDTLVWTFNGGLPAVSNNVQETVIYNTSGTYKAYLEVVGGACGNYAIDSITVTVNPSPNVSISATVDTICSSGSSILTATGASTYSWSPSTGLSCTNCASPVATPTTTTTYTATGTQGGCDGNTSYTIVVEDTPEASYIASTNSACSNDAITFNGSVSSNAATYSWTFQNGSPATSTNSTPSVTWGTAGSYTVTLSVTNNCSQTDDTTFTVSIVDDVTANVTANSFTVCENDNVFYDGTSSIGATTFNWSFTGGDISTSNSSTPTVNYTTAGTYNWELIASGSCGIDTTSGTVQIDVCSGIDELAANSNVNSYFTNSSNLLNLLFEEAGKEKVSLSVVNSIGQTVYSSSKVVAGGDNLSIDLGNISAGMYFIKIEGKTYAHINRFTKF